VVSPPLPPTVPTTAPEDDSKGEVVEGVNDAAAGSEEVMQDEDSFFWSVAYEVRTLGNEPSVNEPC
jgi:hypothetical protein